MKSDLTWTKTILSVYRYLERICGGIDKIINRTALASGIYNKQSFFSNDTMSVSERIIDLSERKVTLINLKLLTEDCLKKISESDARILIARYFDGEKRREMAERLGVDIRTVFRKIERAENSFGKALHMKGFDDEKLSKMLRKEKWICGVYAKHNKSDDEIELSQIYLEKAASM